MPKTKFLGFAREGKGIGEARGIAMPGDRYGTNTYGRNNKSGGSKFGYFLTRLTEPGYDNNARPKTNMATALRSAVQNRQFHRVPDTRNDNTFSNSRSDYSNNGKSPSLK